jgi:hypothetical protein
VNRNKFYIAAVLAFAGLIVAPVVESVNFTKSINVVEGSPLPAPVPKATEAVIVAEGSPLPAPVPKVAEAVFVAEGSPLPAPVPKVVDNVRVA